MAITKFKITKLPIRATLIIGGNAIVLNQEYPIAQQSTIVVNVFDRGIPYDDFEYKLGNSNDIWSENIIATINALTDIGTPLFATLDIDIKLNESNDVTSQFSFDNYTDRVRIKKFTTTQYGKLNINGTDLETSKTYMLYEFINLFFNSDYYGPLQNVVTIMEIQVGSSTEWGSYYNVNFNSRANLQSYINTSSVITANLTTV